MMDNSLTDLRWLPHLKATNDQRSSMSLAQSKRSELEAALNNFVPTIRVDPPRSRISQEGRPQLSFASLISLAIGATKSQGLTLSGIYEWIEEAFPFFKSTEAKAWKNSVRHNLSVRKSMFYKLVCDGQSKRSRAAIWKLKDPEGTQELERALATLPTLEEKTVNRSFANSTINNKNFEPGLTSGSRNDKDGSDISLTEQARTFLTKHNSSSSFGMPIDPAFEDESQSEDSEDTMSGFEFNLGIKSEPPEATSQCVPLMVKNGQRRKKPTSPFILKRRKSYNTSENNQSSVPVCKRPKTAILSRPQPIYIKQERSLPLKKENCFTPPKPVVKKNKPVPSSPTLLQLFTDEEGDSPGFIRLTSPLRSSLPEMDSGIGTPMRVGTLPILSLSPGLIPPFSSTPDLIKASNNDSGL